MHPLLLNGICFFLYTLALLMLLRQNPHTFPAIKGWHITVGEKGKENGKVQKYRDSNKILHDYFFFALSYKATVSYFPDLICLAQPMRIFKQQLIEGKLQNE